MKFDNRKVEIVYNNQFLEKAKLLNKPLVESDIKPKCSVKLTRDETKHINVGTEIIEANFLETEPMGKDDEIIIDFGTHVVGNIDFEIEAVGSPPDAPLLFDLHFAEMPIELSGTLETYEGWISKSWLQMSREYVDVFNHHYTNERRYSFRYLKIKVWDTSQKYKVIFKNFNVKATSAVGELNSSEHQDELYRQISDISIRTLKNCMQEVYEDGPKRDRRLWLGDLYLQAQANYASFEDTDLVKKCLYMFAGTVDTDNRVTSTMFIKPDVRPDDTYLIDYCLHFINTLADYYQFTGDIKTVEELYPTAKNQIDVALSYANEQNLFSDPGYLWSFVDWSLTVKKETSFHGIFLFTLKNMIKLSDVLEPDSSSKYEKIMTKFKASAAEYLFDQSKQLFICDDQVSPHSQIWMVLGEVFDQKTNEAIMNKVLELNLTEQLATPFAHHFFVEALFSVGMRSEAEQHIKAYWGEMVRLGADTFWELFDPNNIEFSPYGSHLANSYCHAWSCTPIYFIKKYEL